MEDEEQEWYNAQLAMPMEGSGLGNEHWVEDESMDVDMSEEEGLDDDFIKGCYSLEIGIGSAPLRIWILRSRPAIDITRDGQILIVTRFPYRESTYNTTRLQSICTVT
jgi:hypothetical protein